MEAFNIGENCSSLIDFFFKVLFCVAVLASDLRKSLPCRARELNLCCMTGSRVLMFVVWCCVFQTRL